MKSILCAVAVIVSIMFVSSCKKEVTPTLIVTIVDSLGKPFPMVNVITHPCYFNKDNCDTANLNPNFHKEILTNSAGQAIFEFPYSAVLDVVAFSALLTSGKDTNGFLYGQTVVSLEVKELKKDQKNEYNTRLVVEKIFVQ